MPDFSPLLYPLPPPGRAWVTAISRYDSGHSECFGLALDKPLEALLTCLRQIRNDTCGNFEPAGCRNPRAPFVVYIEPGKLESGQTSKIDGGPTCATYV